VISVLPIGFELLRAWRDSRRGTPA
jgi:hypothetical protein